jgi:hypothetical protein
MSNLVYTYSRYKKGKIKGIFSLFGLASSAIENPIASYAVLRFLILALGAAPFMLMRGGLQPNGNIRYAARFY